MTLRTITQDEYDRWFIPSDSLKVLPRTWQLQTKIDWLVERLSSGLIVAACGSVKVEYKGVARAGVFVVPPGVWGSFPSRAEYAFWDTGDVTIYSRGITGYGDGDFVGSFYDVRFDPDGLAGKRPPSDETNTGDALTLSGPRSRVTSPIESAPKKPLSGAEYENIARAIAAGWGTSLTEGEAWERAKRIFPDHTVGRDSFLGQYRVLRGDKKRGKQPLRDD